MIKINKENFEIETDCDTVGKFITQAAAFGCDRLEIKVDGCRYEFFDNPKIRVTDDTPIGSVFVDSIGSGGITPDVVRITVLTKPKPKTVRKSGWVTIYNDRGRWMTNRFVFDSKEAAIRNWDGLQEPIAAKIEWDEVTE